MSFPSYVKDSRDPIIGKVTLTRSMYYTMDISAMYMNISEYLGLKAITHFLTNRPELLHQRFSLEFVLDAIPNNNISFFYGQYRRQIHGCAMGSHDSPPYSSLAVGYIKRHSYDILWSSHGDSYADYIKRMLRRFLDDVFIK